MDEKTVARFWRKVNLNGPIPVHRPELGPCHVWTGCLSSAGYGKFGVTAGDVRYAHRMVWVLTNGVIPENICVLHRCDNRRCLNIDHLFTGTKGANSADMATKNRSAFGIRNAQAKLNSADVSAMRTAHAEGESIASLAARFWITRSNVEHILKRRRWKRVA